MAEPQQEKRGARRFALRVPVSVDRSLTNRDAQNEAAQLRDVSALPPEITLTESIRVQCQGRVVRVENGAPDGKVTVAAVIEEYEFLPEA
jgi:hypothetical protein